jgi:hypothetical protein
MTLGIVNIKTNVLNPTRCLNIVTTLLHVLPKTPITQKNLFFLSTQVPFQGSKNIK